MSCPSRGTWIEIPPRLATPYQAMVVPLTGHVDRNDDCVSPTGGGATVVPLTGHVDRNFWLHRASSHAFRVVPLTGHVDRNVHCSFQQLTLGVSCPSRGTWIEISKIAIQFSWKQSCPSRGTWIEILPRRETKGKRTVVPRTGHVDRNSFSAVITISCPPVVPLTGHVDRN